MESRRFDDLSRVMAGGVSRRTVLRGVFGGALTAVGLGSGAAARPNTVDICHRTGNGTYHKISINRNALDAHLAHGDDGNAGWAEGFVFNQGNCECEQANACAGKSIGTSCADDEGICAELAIDRG
jgi:hypothetical protein